MGVLALPSFIQSRCKKVVNEVAFNVVAITVSIGGLKAISKILCALPANFSLGRGAQEAKHPHIQSSEFIHGVAPPGAVNDQ